MSSIDNFGLEHIVIHNSLPFRLQVIVRLGILHLLLHLIVAPIEHKMLNHKDHIIDHTDYTQGQLDGIDIQMLPILTLHTHLYKRKQPTREIQHDIADTPAARGLSLPVPDHLGQVLEEGYG